MTRSFRPAAVITAYRPGPSLLAAVRSVLDQVEDVVVVDDGSPTTGFPDPDVVLQQCTSLGARVVRHDVNRGIGAALNTGIRDARAADPLLTHVLTMDQDSELPPDCLTTLVAAERAASAAGVAVGMTSPGNVATVRGSRSTGSEAFERGGEPIQSGLLLPVATLDAVGEFDESLVIDGVDSDFWLRSLDLGLHAVVAPGVSLLHQLGRPIVLASGRQLPFVVASEFRYYYQWRNLIRLIRRHGRRHPGWAAGAVARATRHLAIACVLAAGRVGRLRATYDGLRAGLRGESGLRPHVS